MSAEVSPVPSVSHRLTLDCSSFEKLLAAAWVLQCVHDQLHCREGDSDEAIVKQVDAHVPAANHRPLIQIATRPVVVSPASLITAVRSEIDVSFINHPAKDETLGELVEAQQAIETRSVDLEAAMKLVAALALKFTKAQGAAVWSFSKGDFTYRAGTGTASNDERLRLAVLSSLAGAWPGKGKPLHAPSAAACSEFRVDATTLMVAPVYHGREVAGALTVSAGSPHLFSDHDRTTLRLMSGLLSHALRKAEEELRAVEPVAIKLATVEPVRHSIPVVTLPANQPPKPALKQPVAVSQPVRRQSFFSFQTAFSHLHAIVRGLRPTVHVRYSLRALRSMAIAPPVWLLVIVAALLILETWRNEPFNSAQAISTRDLSGDTTKRIEHTALQRSIPSPELSHMRATDPATAAVVGDLSRFEIRGLRRQAQYGDDSAAFTLGMAYETARYLHQSCTEAAQWVAMAAEAGNPAAEYNLGLRYRDGDGVPADRTESEKWLRKASAARNPQAQVALKLLASR